MMEFLRVYGDLCSSSELETPDTAKDISDVKDVSWNIPDLNDLKHLRQVDFSLIGWDERLASDIGDSIRTNDVSKYLSSVNVFMGRCMRESLLYVRSIALGPYCGIDNPDPLPHKDRYIFLDNGELHDQHISYYNTYHTKEDEEECEKVEYGRLQYMCDYFKYYVVSSYAENERISIEDEILKSGEEISLLTDLPNPVGIMVTPGGVASLVQEKISGQTAEGEEVNAKGEKAGIGGNVSASSNLVVRLTSEGAVVQEEAEGQVSRNDHDICSGSESASGVDEYSSLMLAIERECSQLVSTKELIKENSILTKKIGSRNTNTFTRDMLIKSFMEYCLSIQDQFKDIADVKFRGKSDLIDEEFSLPIPKEISELIQDNIIGEADICSYASKKGEGFFCNGKLSTSGLSLLDPMKSKIEHVRNNVMPCVVSRMKDYLLNLKSTEDIIFIKGKTRSYIVNIKDKELS